VIDRDIVAAVVSGLVGTIVSTVVVSIWKKRRAARTQPTPPQSTPSPDAAASGDPQ
jgi:hypothetical protein